MMAVMPMWEWNAWRALALVEGQIDDLVREGTDRPTAVQMAWTPSDDDGRDA